MILFHYVREDYLNDTVKETKQLLIKPSERVKGSGMIQNFIL
jgi:hypothetical protein